MSGFFFFFFAQNWKLQQFECLLWQQQIPSAVRPPGGKEEHLPTCCFAAEAHLAAWLTLDVPLDLASVLQAQSLVQLLQDHLQLLDLSRAGQGDLVHRQVDARKPGCKQQQQQKKTPSRTNDILVCSIAAAHNYLPKGFLWISPENSISRLLFDLKWITFTA